MPNFLYEWQRTMLDWQRAILDYEQAHPVLWWSGVAIIVGAYLVAIWRSEES